MRRSAALLLLCALALPALSAVAPAQTQPQAGLSFAAQEPITLDVADIEIVNSYVPPMQDPNVEHLIPVTPADVVKLWAQDRLRAGGQAGRARVIIRQASVKEMPLPRTKGIRGWFTKDQSERYEGTLDVEIRIDRNARGYSGHASTIVSRSTSVREDVSLAERDKALLDLVRAMAQDLNSQLETTIKNNLNPVVIL